ncbi:uncharacterized protein J4E84_001998 [Alternaria hordeiaustralica]|uniref:uncharacterized protein n=1 Tax=Alternaria hordeiaustralica TaxID=1187925 RepID=UPI0020C419D1|nr:uncharacterized protein J4E84_001998 [Alternaria hordeiaustralica]KAI4695372.1 hypothetical protein J4E84_001998 [Alternaria hordeiaustralica]
MSIQKDDKPVTDVESNAPIESAKASYSPQDARSGLLKKPSPQLDVPSYPETGDVKLEMPKHQQKSPTKKNKGKGRRESTVKNTDAADEKTKAAAKLNSDGPAVTKEEENGTESTKTITEPTKPATVDGPTSSAEEHESSPSKSTPALDRPENVADASTVLPPKDSETQEAGQDAKTTQKERDTDVPLNFAGALAKNLETRSDATSIAKNSENTGGGPSSTAPIESPVHLADNDVSDDEAKNDTSFHSAPEIQPESVQAQPQPELQDKAMTTNHETTKSPSIPTETSLDKSPTLITPRNTTQSDPPVAAPPKEDTAPQLPASESTQDPTTTATAQGNEGMSTAAETSPVTATKKAGAQQMQSLHPFAKSNKSQAKREKEARKKQQRKEDADRVAKAKADKAISSQKPNDGPSAQGETGSLGDSVNSPGATGTVAEPEAANSKTGGGSTIGDKKSKGKAKMQPAGTSSTDGEDKAVAESENGKPNGNINDSKDVSSVTHQAEKMEAYLAVPANQGSSGDSGVTPVAEPTPSTPPFVPSITPKAQGSSQKMPAQEVNDPHNLTSNQQTHVPGHSRRSSASTLVGEERVLPSAFAPPAPTHPDSSRTVSPDEAPQLDATPTVAPKKKKKKPKKKKTAPVLPSVDPDPPRDGDYHNYNPFSSQMSHIDAIRRANKYDTTSYYAVTNARMERDAEESRRAARALADLNDHAS